MSTFKSTNRKKNFSNPFGSLADPSAHKQTNKQTNRQNYFIIYPLASHQNTCFKRYFNKSSIFDEGLLNNLITAGTGTFVVLYRIAVSMDFASLIAGEPAPFLATRGALCISQLTNDANTCRKTVYVRGHL